MPWGGAGGERKEAKTSDRVGWHEPAEEGLVTVLVAGRSVEAVG